MDNKESKKIPNWRKRILRIKDGKQIENDDPRDEEASIRILDELSPPSEDDIKTLRKGVRVQFYHYTGESTEGQGNAVSSRRERRLPTPGAFVSLPL